jgi:hypothetical protein
MSLPWDTYKPEVEPEPVPEIPYVPPDNAPAIVGSIQLDYTQILKDAFAGALREVNEQPTSKGTDLVRADARSRSWRTLLQGLAIDFVFALVAVLAILSDLDPFARETWILFGALVIKTFVQTLMAYVMRLRVPPTVRTKGEKVALLPLPVDESKVTQIKGDSA